MYSAKYTHGSASIIGKAVSWILDGRLKPMPYTPWSNCGFLHTGGKKQKDRAMSSAKCFTDVSESISSLYWQMHFSALPIKGQTGRTLLEQVGLMSWWEHFSSKISLRHHKLTLSMIENGLIINIWCPQILQVNKIKGQTEDSLTVATPQRTWLSRAGSWDPSEELPLDSCYWRDYSGSACSIMTAPLCRLNKQWLLQLRRQPNISMKYI